MHGIQRFCICGSDASRDALYLCFFMGATSLLFRGSDASRDALLLPLLIARGEAGRGAFTRHASTERHPASLKFMRTTEIATRCFAHGGYKTRPTQPLNASRLPKRLKHAGRPGSDCHPDPPPRSSLAPGGFIGFTEQGNAFRLEFALRIADICERGQRVRIAVPTRIEGQDVAL